MRIRSFAWLAFVAAVAACDDSLVTEPTASIDDATALNSARGIQLGINGAYRSFQTGTLYGVNMLAYPDLYADNLDFTGTFQTDREFGLHDVSTDNTAVRDIWATTYSGINRVNNILDAIPNVGDLDPDDADQYRGEALFMRGLHYALLAKWFGGVPVLTEPSRGVGDESLVSRNTLAEVYSRIETDLEEAATLLPPSNDAGRATSYAAHALLARIYLEQGEDATARDKATLVIAGGYALTPDYADVFATKNSEESIFELQYSINNSNSAAFWFFPQALGGRWGFAPSADLIAAYEPDDARLDASIGMSGADPFGQKYFRIANGDDNIVILRLAEMYLIRAEANANLGADPATVRADLDELRNRAGLPDLPTTVTAQADLLAAVLQERRVEFAMEGHRFFDLRRMGVATTVLQMPADRLLLPIPQAERDVNPNLEQNPGY